MLFGERDVNLLNNFFEGNAHATLLLRNGGFHELEETMIAEKFLGDQRSNLLKLEAQDGKKGVGVEQVRILASSLSTSSRDGERRLVLVSDRFVFGPAAQNTFLKILEEPPKGVFFLLLANSEESFLSTISSRSQILKLTGVSEEEIINYLVNELNLNKEEAKMLSLQSGGNVAEVLRLAHDEKARKESLKDLSLAKTFLGQNSYDRLVTLKNFQNAGKRDEATNFLKSLLVVLELASNKSAKETLRWADLVEKVERSLVNINLNANSKVELLNLI